MKKFEQIKVKIKSQNEAKVYLDLPHFKYPKLLGTLYRDSKIFRTIPRSYNNLFHLFGQPGLGINSEILSRLNFDFIEIPYNNEVLKTTRAHFIKHSIPSPFVSGRVDKQLILKISDFYLPTPEQPKEITLFDEFGEKEVV